MVVCQTVVTHGIVALAGSGNSNGTLNNEPVGQA
jgi:hypothetical protein